MIFNLRNSFLALMSVNAALASCESGYMPMTINFEEFASGSYITNVGGGIRVRTTGRGYNDEGARIYQTDRAEYEGEPGLDPDLDLAGAAGNHGKVLIIQETEGTEPDDNGSGGRIFFESTAPFYVKDITLLDVEQPATLKGFLDGSRVFSVNSAVVPDGGMTSVDLSGYEGINRFVVRFAKSAAIAEMEVCVVTPVFITASYDNLLAGNNAAVNFLDEEMNLIGGFDIPPVPHTSLALDAGQAITSDGYSIYVRSQDEEDDTTSLVIVYSFAGVEERRFQLGGGNYIGGMDMVEGELAAGHPHNIEFYDPASGSFIRAVNGPFFYPHYHEGFAYDGDLLWYLAYNSDFINGTDVTAGSPTVGTIVSSIDNAAKDCIWQGTGMTTGSNDGELMLGCVNGDWFLVSSADGSVIDSGNNGVDMFGLKKIPVF